MRNKFIKSGGHYTHERLYSLQDEKWKEYNDSEEKYLAREEAERKDFYGI